MKLLPLLLLASVAAGCGDARGEKAVLWDVDAYAAPGESATYAAGLFQVLDGQVEDVEVESASLGLKRTRVHEATAPKTYPSRMESTSTPGPPKPERFQFPVPAGAAAGRHDLVVHVHYSAAIWSHSGAFEIKDRIEPVPATLHVVSPGMEWPLRAGMAALWLGIPLLAGFVLGMLTRPAAILPLWLVVLAGSGYAGLEVPRILGLPGFWIRVGAVASVLTAAALVAALRAKRRR